MKRFSKFLLYFGALVLLLLLGLGIGTRWVLDDISSYRTHITELLEERFQILTDIGDLSAELEGLGLVVHIEDLQIKPSKESDKSIAVAKAKAYINLWQSVLQWSPVLNTLHLSDADIQLNLDQQHHLSMPGLPASIPVQGLALLGSRKAATQFDLPDVRIDGLDIRLRHPYHSDPIHLNDVHASYTPSAENLVELGVNLPKELGKTMRFRLAAQGQAHLQLDALALGEILTHFQVAHDVDGLWSLSMQGNLLERSADGLPKSLAGVISVRDPSGAWAVDSLKSDWSWQASTMHRQLSLADTSLELDGDPVSISRLTAKQQRLASGHTRVTFDAQDIEVTQALEQALHHAQELLAGQGLTDFELGFKKATLSLHATQDYSEQLFIASPDFSLPEPISLDALQDLQVASAANKLALQATLQDAQFSYAELPAVSGASVEVNASNDGAQFTLREGKLGELAVETIQLDVRDWDKPRAQAKWEVAGTLDEVFALMAHLSLPEPFASMNQDMQAGGPVAIQGEADFALQDKQDESAKKSAKGSDTFRSSLDLKGAQLQFDKTKPALKDIEGTLVVTQDGMHAKNIKARFAEHPVLIEANTTEQHTAFTITAKDFPAATIARIIEIPPALIKGATDVRTDVLLPSATGGPQQSLDLVVHSQLQGIAVDAPHPLGKAAEQSVPLKVELIGFDDNPDARITYGASDTVVFTARHKAHDLLQFSQRASTPTTLPAMPPIATDALAIVGTLGELSVSEWQEWWDTHADSFQADGKTKRLDYADLAVKDLELTHELRSAMRVSASRDQKKRLKVKLASAPLSGTLTLPKTNKERLYADIEHLHIKTQMAAQASTTTATAGKAAADASADKGGAALRPQDLPPIVAKIKRLEVDTIRLDNAQLVTRPSTQGLVLSSFKFENRYKGKRIMAGNMTGRWTQVKGKDRSRLNLSMKASDYGRLLRNWSYSTGLRETNGKLSAKLAWDSPIYQLDIATLTGKASLRLKDGRLRELNNPAGKLIGLFNASALARRFSSDFRNLFRKGLTFKRLKGELHFKDGNMYTDPLTIKGDGLNIGITGRTGIVARDYDQEIYAVPNFSQGAPVAAALLGGPIAAAVAFAVNKVSDIGSTIDEALTLRYTLTGTWEDPKIEFVEVPKVNPTGKVKSLLDDLGTGVGAVKDKAMEGVGAVKDKAMEGLRKMLPKSESKSKSKSETESKSNKSKPKSKSQKR